MERKAFLALRNPRWEKLFTEVDIEVELVPSEMPDLTTQKLLGMNSDSMARDICTKAFINFKGWVDEPTEEHPKGKPVANTLDNRLEMYSFPAIRKAIQNALEVRNFEVVTGESFAVSD